MLTIQQVVNEVDTLVPNPFDPTNKVTWLNEINREFFEVVKIPAVYQFVTTAGVDLYTIPNTIKSRNIERVQTNQSLFKSMQHDDINPGHNFWLVEDTSLKLHPSPSLTGEIGIIKYFQSSKTTFLASDLSVKPDAPEEYHWAYVLGLAERVAKAMNDVSLANNYGNDYRAQLSLAQQNYATSQQGG